MSQPTPPGDIPLYDGLGSEWNDIVSGFPEDKRAELAPKLKERIDSYESYKQWDEFQKSGITPDQAKTALDLFSTIENDPRRVYETLGKYLGISTQEAKEVVKEVNAGNVDPNDPRAAEIAALKHQVDTLSQITIAQRQQEIQEQEVQAQSAALEKELDAVKKKFGAENVDEDEIIMRMYDKGITAEQAHLQYMQKVEAIRARRPAPMVLGGSGAVPQRQIDVTKLNNMDTKNLVAQMMQQAVNQQNG